MSRSRTTKQIAKRIDKDYFQIPNGLRRANTLLILAAIAGSVLWVGVWGMGKNQSIYNPGPVSLAHGHFESNCRACHDGGNADGAGFSLTVSDQACLRCHDGPVHHSNQTSLVAVHDERQVSAGCASCHVEHRGHPALAATSDQHCTQCHADLTRNSTNPPRIEARVISFAGGDGSHPEFGRPLLQDAMDPASGWIDNTRLKFNHKYHLEQYKNEPSMANCWGCHSTGAPNPHARLYGVSDVPPWRSEKDRHPGWTVSSDYRYVEPVRYDHQCKKCHEIQIRGGPALAHEDMTVVRSQIGGLVQMYITQLAIDPDRQEKLTKTTTGPPPRRLKTVKTITEQEWVDEQLGSVEAEVRKWFESEDAMKRPGYEALVEALKEMDAAKVGLHPSVIEFYIAYGASNSCAKCHEVTGVPPAAYARLAAAKPADDSAATQMAPPTLLTTVPTGIPSTPRRWFANSQFDHDAHRNQSCLDCHGGVQESALTSDLHMPRMEACTQCHHAPTLTSRSAGSDCVTCHVFHDRSRERPFTLPKPGGPDAPAVAVTP